MYNPVTFVFVAGFFFLNDTRIDNLFSLEIIDFLIEFMYTLSCIFMFKIQQDFDKNEYPCMK